jgi:WD40 repeat protein
VQWRNQDEGGALLRDQLRQAAQAWHDRGRPDDLLWTGTSYRELSLWRERYTGGVSSTEEAFAQAAAKLAGRRRRRRRIAVASAFAGLLAVMAVVLESRQLAVEEARNREAAQLLSLGRLRLEDHPSAALAYALASLERADNEPARLFTVEALWQGPTEFVFGTEEGAVGVRFSPDGRFMAYGTPTSARLLESGGGPGRVFLPDISLPEVDFSDDGRLLLADPPGDGPLQTFSMPEVNGLGPLPLAGDANTSWFPRRDRVLTITRADESSRRTVVSVPLSGEPPRALGTWDSRGVTDFDVTVDGSSIAAARGGRLILQSLDRLGEPVSNGAGEGAAGVIANRARPEVVTVDGEGRALRVWSVEGGKPTLRREVFGLPSETITRLALDPQGRFVSVRVEGDRLLHRVWDLDAPPDTEPLALRDRDTEGWLMQRDFDPTGRWLAVPHARSGTLWALHEKRPRVLRGLKPPYFTALNFSPDGRYLVSASFGGAVWRFALDPRDGPRQRLFYEGRNMRLGSYKPLFDAERRLVVVTDQDSRVLFIPLDGGKTQEIDVPHRFAGPSQLREDGRLLAVSAGNGPGSNEILLRDLKTGEERSLSLDDAYAECEGERRLLNPFFVFLRDGRVLSDGGDGLRIFDLTTEKSTQVRGCQPGAEGADFTVAPDGRTVLVAYVSEDPARTSTLFAFDLETRTERAVNSHGDHVTAATLDPEGRFIVSGSGDGLVRFGPLDESEEPHLLYGHTAQVTSVAVSLDGHWIASAAEDGTIRLWPMPEGRPLHTFPYEELVAKLRSLTNLRVVADAGSATGYKVEPGPFPGWAKFPKW